MSRVAQEAARWFARMQGAPEDHPDRARFEAWLDAHPSHAAEFETFAELLRDLRGGVNGEDLAKVMRQRQERRRNRRRLLKQGLAGLLVGGIGIELVRYATQNRISWQTVQRTDTGESAAQTALADGSSVILSAACDLEVHYTSVERRADLRRGAAIFEVSRDPDRPFVVDAGAARVTVLGTRFVVNRLSEKVRVSVDHGRVQVDAGPFWRRRQLTLTDGQVAEVTSSGGRWSLQVLERRASDELAFAHGTLMFDQADLGEIAETLSRYRKSPVRVRRSPGTDPSAAPIRVVGVVRTSDVEGFIDLLPRLAPVTVSREGDAVWLREANKEIQGR